MAIASDQATSSICSHCDRAIPSSNIDLHYAHCSRNLEQCKVCGDMVARKYAEEHFLSTHAPVSCSLCSETMEREILPVHKGIGKVSEFQELKQGRMSVAEYEAKFAELAQCSTYGGYRA
ncbi:XIAP-associated factor 1-like [Camellia sinensis]|uniref:XIAP-associated factor 1-like n=1 Tax=Camellia sinensis TaxID=4442 RepID=UPI001036BF47|nr:XIAP-associated factor 1-like [Camellia sinensis]